MELRQQNNKFSPIALVLESRDEAMAFWDMILRVKDTTDKGSEHEMALEISDWMTSEAKL
jgi:hypothetical protein